MAGKHFASRMAIIGVLLSVALPVTAQSIIDEWNSVKTPPPPQLKPVTLDRKTTALLLLDFNRQTCEDRRPRCTASIPKVKKLLASAREAAVPVAFTLGGGGKPEDMSRELTPTKDEPIYSSGLDKFAGTDLEAFLKKHGVKTVVIAGTASHGAVLYTATTAAEHGMQVVIPIEAMAGDSPYTEQYAAWHLVNAPRIGQSVTLTRVDDVKF